MSDREAFVSGVCLGVFLVVALMVFAIGLDTVYQDVSPVLGGLNTRRSVTSTTQSTIREIVEGSPEYEEIMRQLGK